MPGSKVREMVAIAHIENKREETGGTGKGQTGKPCLLQCRAVKGCCWAPTSGDPSVLPLLTTSLLRPTHPHAGAEVSLRHRGLEHGRGLLLPSAETCLSPWWLEKGNGKVPV